MDAASPHERCTPPAGPPVELPLPDRRVSSRAVVTAAAAVQGVSVSHGGIGRMPGAGQDQVGPIDPVVRRAEEAARAVLASATLADLAVQTTRSAMYYI